MNPDFYDLSLAKFLQGSPELGNMIISFKDVSNELQENTGIKVGVFILRSGTEVFYVPVVSKDENVYPIDSIFFASKRKFFPLTKKTVALVVNSSQMSQGRAKKIPNSVTLNPDMTELINPPRTGKFVSASTSRLSDFMASLPDYLKDFTLEKISQEKSVYENINKLFNIKDIFQALKSAPKGMPSITNEQPISMITGAAIDMTPEEISNVLNNGYSFRGNLPHQRIAIGTQNYEDGTFTKVVELDGNSDYELVFDRGNSREAFIPKMINIGVSTPQSRRTVALFTNGDYAVDRDFIAKGTKLDRKQVLDTIFQYNPPMLPRDLATEDVFTIMDINSNIVGVFQARKITLSHLGVEISARVISGPGDTVQINAYRSYGLSPTLEGKNIYIPYSSLIIKLGEDVTSNLERSVNSANRKYEMNHCSLLGDQLNLGFDGVEFSVNGSVLGQESDLMRKLVLDEGIDPTLASTFVKQAKERKATTIYLSKKAAAFQAGEIPQFGEKLAPADKTGLNGSFIPNVQKSLVISDAQATEATIISELLQAPNMFELIEEYIPDLEEAVDKLGRIMFLSRVHISKLSENNDADSVFSFLSNLKAVYRMLGDNLIKLQELIVLKPNNSKN